VHEPLFSRTLILTKRLAGMSGILKERHKFACHDVCFNLELHEGRTKPRFHETSEILMECQES